MQAMKSLNEIASIKAEAERVIITLSGEVLFKFNEATLLPIARSRLDKVAEVLKNAGDGKPIVIAGHTDSRGSSGYNAELSRQRAEAVRSYLVGKGVPENMIATSSNLATNLLLDLVGLETVQRSLDTFGIETDSDDAASEAAFVIGKYRTPSLYVSYGIGLLDPVKTVKLRYEISKRWRLVTESSSEASGGDVFYNIERGR